MGHNLCHQHLIIIRKCNSGMSPTFKIFLRKCNPSLQYFSGYDDEDDDDDDGGDESQSEQ